MSSTLCGLLLICLVLVGCQSKGQFVGSGTVLQYQQTTQRDYHPKKRTKIGTAAGATTGAVAGVAVASVASAVTFGLAAPLFVPVVASSTAMGAGAGAGAGYAADKIAEGTRVYLYDVALDETDEVILVYHTTRAPHQPGTRVRVHKVRNQWVVKET